VEKWKSYVNFGKVHVGKVGKVGKVFLNNFK
jgi:hypothetical protein